MFEVTFKELTAGKGHLRTRAFGKPFIGDMATGPRATSNKASGVRAAQATHVTGI